MPPLAFDLLAIPWFQRDEMVDLGQGPGLASNLAVAQLYQHLAAGLFDWCVVLYTPCFVGVTDNRSSRDYVYFDKGLLPFSKHSLNQRLLHSAWRTML